MYHFFWGFPPLTVMFLGVFIVDTTANYCAFKRQRVPGMLVWRILLFRLYFCLLPPLAMLWLVSTEDWHGHILPLSFASHSAALAFMVLALVQYTLLTPVYRKYKQAALDLSAYRVWGR